jgi:putative hydrolase of the HAD superfamily
LTRIAAVLFDADGVIQRPSATWRPSLEALCTDAARRGDFLAEIFAAERRCIAGAEGFDAALAPVLAAWGCAAPVAEVLALWRQIDADPAALALVASLRARGVTVALATNQHAARAAYMSDGLGYAARFDHLFYSCALGCAKPSAAFFHAALERLALPARAVLFVDDHQANVAAARDAGMLAEQVSLDDGPEALVAVVTRHLCGS